jgi:hypothetical protein
MQKVDQMDVIQHETPIAEFVETGLIARRRFTLFEHKITIHSYDLATFTNTVLEIPVSQINDQYSKVTLQNPLVKKGLVTFLTGAIASAFIYYQNGNEFWNVAKQLRRTGYFSPIFLLLGLILIWGMHLTQVPPTCCG